MCLGYLVEPFLLPGEGLLCEGLRASWEEKFGGQGGVTHNILAESPKCGLSQRRWS